MGEAENVSLQLPELCSHVAVTAIALKTKPLSNIWGTTREPTFSGKYPSLLGFSSR